MNMTEDLPLASNDIDVQLLDSAKSGDLETVKVCIAFLRMLCSLFVILILCIVYYGALFIVVWEFQFPSTAVLNRWHVLSWCAVIVLM